MPYVVNRKKIGRLNSWLLALLAFSLPLSTSAISVLSLLVLACWFIEGGYRDKLREIITNPVCLAVLFYLALYIAGLLWSENRAAGLAMIGRQWKLLLLPVFMTAGRREDRRLYAGSFLAGMTVAMLMTYLAWFGLLHYADVSPEHLTKGTFHVVYDPMLAFAIYLLLHEFIWGETRGVRRWFVFGLAALMVFDMFITKGRAGQMAFFVLLGLLLFQILRKNLVLAFLLTIFVLPATFTAGYLFSPTFHGRVQQARSDIASFHVNPETSVGLRLLYWKNSWEIIKRTPWFGVGTGDFQEAYAQVNRQLSPQVGVTDNPHNQYVLVQCQLGLLGLAALLGIFLLQFRQAFTLRDGWERIRVAFPLFFLTIMLTESYLIVYETGFLFSLFSAVLYRLPAKPPQAPHLHAVAPARIEGL